MIFNSSSYEIIYSHKKKALRGVPFLQDDKFASYSSLRCMFMKSIIYCMRVTTAASAATT